MGNEKAKIWIDYEGPKDISSGDEIKLGIKVQGDVAVKSFRWTCGYFRVLDGREGESVSLVASKRPGTSNVRVQALDNDGNDIAGLSDMVAIQVHAQKDDTPFREGIEAINNMTERLTGGGKGIPLQSRSADLRPNKALYVHIRESTKAIEFKSFKNKADAAMCGREYDGNNPLRFHGEEAFIRLRKCADRFLMKNVGVEDHLFDAPSFIDPDADIDDAQNRLKKLSRDDEVALEQLQDNADKLLVTNDPDNPDMLPYSETVRNNRSDLPLKKGDGDNCTGLLEGKLTRPLMIELIWSYWMEEGMLVQSLNAILTRFQNRKVPGIKGGLDHLNISPLRPLSNLLWGYIQNPHRPLSVRRRALEYLHEYGFKLKGLAVGPDESVESRTTFIRALHNLLNTVSGYYREMADTTKVPSAFSVLNSLREVHMVLAEGAHNQYGDLPWTARRDMLIQSWILARPEIRDFLRGRDMVPYPEEWMQSVDQLKSSAGWSPVSVRHFRDLAVFGEKILLSARFGNWSDIYDENEAALWAEYFRQEIKGYIHAYKTVTGVDLGVLAVADQKDMERKWSKSPSDLIIMGTSAQG